MSTYPHYQTVTYTEQKFSENIFCKGVQLCFETSLFEQNFYEYVTVYLVRKWTYKNAKEKAHNLIKNIAAKIL